MTEPSITCPVCGMTSYNPNDIEHGYCGNCHAFTRRTVPRVETLIMDPRYQRPIDEHTLARWRKMFGFDG